VITWRTVTAILFTPTLFACGGPDDAVVELPLDSAQLVAQKAIAERLVIGLLPEPGNDWTSVEINHDALDSVAHLHAGESWPLSDPLRAARTFAWAIDLPADAEFELLERLDEPGEGSGLLVAVVRARTHAETITMRLVSDAGGPMQPQIWTLNDFETRSR